ncbi:uncharacterized protein LOC111276647 isoform X1 [Durio zibethinus]|uniref:Uncharacterized protein LOC111276647 isoform X1 n=1 Tax=Durio zibethinus TaxID=66656 RepID=A0A6P5WPS4_DURZI|nr:uncharacterized protein LOC111276647 isoform X1 [Durio zibethinus]
MEVVQVKTPEKTSFRAFTTAAVNHPALVSSGEVHHMAIEECLSTEASIVFDDYLRKAENKRKIDKAYRERCKMKKLQMEQDMVTFVEENKRLKIENESLKEKNASMNQILQSRRKELNEVKNIVENLKFENKKQNALAQILSDLLVNPDMCQENQKLKDENAQLTEMVKLSDEQLKIVKENGKLHHENMLLKVQIDALCGKIVHQNSKICGHKLLG